MQNTKKPFKYLKNNLRIKFRNMGGADCTPNANQFLWNFPHGHVKAVFGLESGCIEM